jgi:hypothetical protein
MKFLKFTIAAFLLSMVFVACEKNKDVIPAPPPPPAPIPVTETKPVQGTWMGNRYGYNKSVPFEFGFNVKAQGKLDVLNASKQVIGTGSWNFDNDVFTAAYIITSSGVTYSLRSDFFNKPDNIGGTWGFDSDNSNGGVWEMTKVN